MRAAGSILVLLALGACEVPVHLGDWCADCSPALVDAGTIDAGVVDAGVVDAGVADAGVVDAGAVDAGVVDAGVVDAGVVDAGVVDAGVVDAGAVVQPGDGGPPTPAEVCARGLWGCAWAAATQTAFIKPRSIDSPELGTSVALSADGALLLAGAPHEGQGGSGVNPPLYPLGSSSSGAALLYSRSDAGWALDTVFKASNARSQMLFGSSLAISADGMTLVVGAPQEISAARGVNGDQQNLDAPHAGAVYVFSRASGAWRQEAYLKPSDTVEYMEFGGHLALSADGQRLVVGAQLASRGGWLSSGAAYVFERSGGAWSERQVLTASNPGVDDWFGSAVALSADGRTLAVTADGEDSNATGLNGDQANNLAYQAGAVYLFELVGSAFAQVAYVKPRDANMISFGASLALSPDGTRLAVGAPLSWPYETGAVALFERLGGAWRVGPTLAPQQARYAEFGTSVAFDARGDTLLGGGSHDGSGTLGVNQPPLPMVAAQSGAAWVFARNPGGWTEMAYLKASNTRKGAWFGAAVALSADATVAAVGAPRETTRSTGVGAAQGPDSTSEVGAVYVMEVP